METLVKWCFFSLVTGTFKLSKSRASSRPLASTQIGFEFFYISESAAKIEYHTLARRTNFLSLANFETIVLVLKGNSTHFFPIQHLFLLVQNNNACGCFPIFSANAQY